MSTTSTNAAATGDRLRVAVWPHDHPYVQRVMDREAVDLVPLRDGRISPAWLTRHASDIDVVHLHQGLACPTVTEIEEVVAGLAHHRLPLVLTVHDSPGPKASEVDPLLAALVPEAAAVIATTPTAASELSARWSTHALVVPHPHVAPSDRLAANVERRAGPWRVGMYLLGPDPTVAAAMEDFVAQQPGVVVQVRHATAHHRAPGGGPVRGGVEDPEVAAWIAELDMLLLPPRISAKHTWIELCRDLGTGAVVGVSGADVSRGAVACYPINAGQPMQVAITRALVRGSAQLPVARVSVEERLAEAAQVRADHVALYRAVMAATSNPDGEGQDDDELDRRPLRPNRRVERPAAG